MKRSRGVLVLAGIAFLSISANLLLLGIAFGEHFRPHPRHFELDSRLERLRQRMPEPDQPVVRAIIDHRHDALGKRWNEFRDGVEGARLALRANPFRADLAATALAEENRRYEAYRVAMQELLVEIAGQVSQAGREQLFPSHRGLGE